MAGREDDAVHGEVRAFPERQAISVRGAFEPIDGRLYGNQPHIFRQTFLDCFEDELHVASVQSARGITVGARVRGVDGLPPLGEGRARAGSRGAAVRLSREGGDLVGDRVHQKPFRLVGTPYAAGADLVRVDEIDVGGVAKGCSATRAAMRSRIESPRGPLPTIATFMSDTFR